jgi:hypothetical protein
MTSSQPPTPGGYGPPPEGGQPGYPPPQGSPPGYPPPAPGQQPGPPPGAPPGPPPGPTQGGPAYGAPPPYAPPTAPYGQPAATGGGFSFDVKKLRMADYIVVGGMIVFLVMAILPWVDVAHYLGIDVPGVDTTVSGFTFSGLVTFSFVLFFLAAAWAVLPAFTDVKVGFPRAWITVGLAALGFVLTLIAWIRSLTYGFEIWPLIGLLAAAAVTLFAFLGLIPEMQNRPALAGRIAGAAQWANQQAPDLPRQFGGAGGQPNAPPPPPYGQPAQPPAPPPPYGQPAQPPAQPPQFTKPGVPSTPPYHPGPGDTQAYPAAPGGSTAAGQTPPATPGVPYGTPGEDSQRPVDPT